MESQETHCHVRSELFRRVALVIQVSLLEKVYIHLEMPSCLHYLQIPQVSDCVWFEVNVVLHRGEGVVQLAVGCARE